jgi:hypothetical protein
MEKTEIEKAQELINAEIKRVDEECWNKIQETLKEYNRQLIPVGRFQGNQMEYSFSLVATK